MTSPFGRSTLLALAATLSAPLVQAADWSDTPWHLRGPDTAPAAPSGINTAHIKPGPHAVVVAVIDSGVLPEHPSLVGQTLPGYDMQSTPRSIRGGRSSNPKPDERDSKCQLRASSNDFRTHGTEIASLIAGNGWQGMVGVNTKARILPVRVAGVCGMERQDLMDALSWAAGLKVPGIPDNPNPAKVINLSLSGGASTCSPELQAQVDRLIERNVFIVAAAGNNFRRVLPEPANCRGVISVGAVDPDNKIEFYSALDTRTSMYVPGGGKRLAGDEPWHLNRLKVGTYETDIFGGEKPLIKERGVGTSYAAPVVTGFISLWLSYRPHGTVREWLAELPQFLRPLPPPDDCPKCMPLGLLANSKVALP